MVTVMKRNKSILFILIFLLLSQFPAEAFAERTRDARKERTFIYRQRKALKEAEELFLKGDYKGVVKVCQDIFYLAKKFPSKRRSLDKLYYLAGASCLKVDNIAHAKLYLNKIISNYKRSKLLPDAYLALAEVHFQDRDYTEATRLLLLYLRTYPTGPSIPQAYLRLGQIAQKQGRWEESKYYFDKIKKDFPLSFEARLIPSLSSEEDFFFTVQVGSFNNLENARELKKKLEKGRYSPYIVEARSSGSTFYRVRVGRFKTKTEARHLAKELKKQGFQTKIYP